MGKKSVLTMHKEIARDAAKTITANSQGGRYYKPTLAERLAQAAKRKRSLL